MIMTQSRKIVQTMVGQGRPAVRRRSKSSSGVVTNLSPKSITIQQHSEKVLF